MPRLRARSKDPAREIHVLGRYTLSIFYSFDGARFPSQFRPRGNQCQRMSFPNTVSPLRVARTSSHSTYSTGSFAFFNHVEMSYIYTATAVPTCSQHLEEDVIHRRLDWEASKCALHVVALGPSILIFIKLASQNGAPQCSL